MTPNLGDMPLDLPKLLESRLLLVAGSGSGKSYALRRVLEQTATHVQQLVIDPDGEFASLRERYDYIICAPSGADAVATPATAAALAAALWKAGTSAVLDISDLAPHDRILFVRRFFETLIAQPRSTWHSCLVALDEAQLFAPQIGEAESSQAVIDMAARGRKRGICLLPATQRIAKLSKDVAAEMRNKLIGGMSLDIDLARAGDELGFTAKDRGVLRTLEPGEFFAYGPALCREVTRTRIGPVETTHPQLGQRIAVPPPPSAKIRAQLGKLEGLQIEAAAELATVDELRAELAKLRKSHPGAAAPAAPAGHSDAQVQALVAAAVERERSQARDLVATLIAIRDLAATASSAGRAQIAQPIERAPSMGPAATKAVIPPGVKPQVRPASGVTAPQQRILHAIAELNAFGIEHPAKPMIGAHAGASPRSSGFTNNLSSLRTAGLVDYPGAGLVALTAAGREKVPAVAKPTLRELHESWLTLLPRPQQAIVNVLIECHPHEIGKADLAQRIGVSSASSGYTNNLSSLRTLGLLDYPHAGYVVATALLFPKETR